MPLRKASRTAQHNALFRALEQGLPAPLFHDPWARRFLRGRYRWAARVPAAWAARLIDRRWPGPRAAVSVRTRYIDDAVRRAAADGLDQLVILGAGLDARAYRMPELRSLRVFEVDHPETQRFKRRVVGDAPAWVTYVAVDLGGEDLALALAAAGFDPARRTLLLWEGVTNYLDAASVGATLRFAAANARELIFTYVERRLLEDPASFRGGAAAQAYVREIGEPFTFGLVPEQLPAYLGEYGLALEEDHALSALAPRYYVGPPPPVSAYYHVARARCRG
jgi:methyltransferase (TIGR00027 family)